MSMTLAMAERETHIGRAGDEDQWVIRTEIPADLHALRKDDRFTEVHSGHYGEVEWAEFTIPKDRWSPVSGAKRRVSAEQRAALADRLRDNMTKAA